VARRFLRGGSALRQGQRRQTLWGDFAITETSIGGATKVLTNVTGATILAIRPVTLVRARFHLGIESDQQIAGEAQIAAWGLCVVIDQAVAVGVTAVPGPITDAGSDAWVAHQYLTSTFAFVTAAGVEAQFQTSMDVDSKAMRKIEEGFQLISVVETSSLSNGAVITQMGRVLLKLH